MGEINSMSSSPGETRRAVVMALGAGSLAGAFPAIAALSSAAAAEFEAMERDLGGRLGIAAASIGDGRALAYRANERFPMCSTFKLLLAGAVLRRVDQGRESLARPIRYGTGDLLSYAPVAKAHVADGAMTIGELCAAAVTVSDNTAANLLLAHVGGPPAVTAFARTLGDPVTRLDRIEPALNVVPPGDVRDTTSPAAMTRNLRRLVLGDALSVGSRERLTQWLVGCKTGDARVRAGAPAGARVGDKTGTWSDEHTVTANDVAVIWPVRGSPILIAVYIDRSRAGAAATEQAIARTTRTVCAALGAV
jgi:beta-lactamase class A